jgi:mycofactocin system glycosyltransferase
LRSLGEVGEIIVVDDGSSDERATRLAAEGSHLFRHAEPLGPAAARERGWRAATRPVIAFVDADIDADPGWLDTVLAHLDDAAVAAVAPRVRSSRRQAPRWLAAYEEVRSPLDLGPLPAIVRPGSRAPYVPTAALVVRREALEAVEGFDTRMLVGEDVDLVWRLEADGWRVRYEPGAVVRHPSRPGLRDWLRQRVAYGSSAALLARRHGRHVAPLRISGWSLLMWSAALLGRPGLGVCVGAATTAGLVPKLRELEHPVAESVRIAGLGNLRAGTFVADALRRPWWPFAVLLAVVWPRSRSALCAVLLVPPLLEWRERRPPLDPIRFVLLRTLDDLAYGAGVWLGCFRTESWVALAPALSGPMPPVPAPSQA